MLPRCDQPVCYHGWVRGQHTEGVQEARSQGQRNIFIYHCILGHDGLPTHSIAPLCTRLGGRAHATAAQLHRCAHLTQACLYVCRSLYASGRRTLERSSAPSTGKYEVIGSNSITQRYHAAAIAAKPACTHLQIYISRRRRCRRQSKMQLNATIWVHARCAVGLKTRLSSNPHPA